MNRLKIIGLVAAFHVVLFLCIFAIPGCRSTGKTAASETAPAVSAAPADSPVTAAPPPPAPGFDPFAPAAGPRVAPTRPGSPAAAALVTPPEPVAPPAPPAPAATSYVVKNGDNLWNLARKNSVTVRELAAANKITADAVLRPGQKLLIPAAPGKAATAPVPTTEADTNTYTVKSGDKLSVIAQRNHTTTDAIKALNNLASDSVHAGQKLKLPVVAPSGATLAPVATGGLSHTVKPGETLGDIAKKYGLKVGDLAVANNITDPKKLRVGQELKIPTKNVSTAAPAEVSPISPAPPPPAAAISAAPAPTSMFNFTLPSSIEPSPAASPISPAPPSSGPVIKIEGDGAPKIP
jgi:LysM repeat protein